LPRISPLVQVRVRVRVQVLVLVLVRHLHDAAIGVRVQDGAEVLLLLPLIDQVGMVLGIGIHPFRDSQRQQRQVLLHWSNPADTVGVRVWAFVRNSLRVVVPLYQEQEEHHLRVNNKNTTTTNSHHWDLL
jgi:hypothetical protein